MKWSRWIVFSLASFAVVAANAAEPKLISPRLPKVPGSPHGMRRINRMPLLPRPLPQRLHLEGGSRRTHRFITGRRRGTFGVGTAPAMCTHRGLRLHAAVRQPSMGWL